MNFEDYKQNHTKRHKICRGTYLYTCKLCWNKTMTIEDHFKWIHKELSDNG